MNFGDTIRQAGLLPNEVLADGRIHRCPTVGHERRKNGWYVLHNGIGYWGDWSDGGYGAQGKWVDERVERMSEDKRKRLEDKLRAHQEEQRRKRREAIAGAVRYWNESQSYRPHRYIIDKGLSSLGCDGLRINGEDLVVPVRTVRSMCSVQRIAGDGKKLFHYGAPVRSGFHVIDRKPFAITCICEGLATGLAIFQALRTSRVVIAFNAGNMLSVVETLTPTGNVVIVADNDHGTEARRGFNPGLRAAHEAADAIGAGVAVFSGIEGTDAADAMREWGEHARGRIRRTVEAASRYVARTKQMQ